ncbi:hypothetical protein H4Q26_012947 [Puccinia striiformis f. sp. tritici PST-130]|nr:hypothetical protein H4Q26_012947 [Puccinia striiformis f. sp. tritici PST-130]
MRPLTDTLFSKLNNYVGKNLVHLINREDEEYCFRFHRDRVFYISENLMKSATSISKDTLISSGICLGKFSKTGKFKLHITSLDIISKYAQYKVWIKPNGEMPFLYGNHVVKAHLGRITEDTPEHQGGFGVTARSTTDTKKLDPTSILVYHQADVGEYLRDEDTLF